MKTLFLVVFAMAALMAREAGAGELVFMGGRYLPKEMKFTNRLETFQTLAGRGFTNVELRSVTSDGLIWSKPEGLVSGRVGLDELDASTQERLGIPPEYLAHKQQIAAQRQKAKTEAIFARMDREHERQMEGFRRRQEERAMSHFNLGPSMIDLKYGAPVATNTLGRLVVRVYHFKDYQICVIWEGTRCLGEALKTKPTRKMTDEECLALARAIAATGDWETDRNALLDSKWSHSSGDFIAWKPFSFLGDQLFVFHKDSGPAIRQYLEWDAGQKAEGF